MSPRAGRAALALGLGGAALAVAWALAAPGTPPLYDGPVVVAPYRYLCIPDGYQQIHAVTTRMQDVKVTNGSIEGGGVFVTSDEMPLGQVQVLVNGEDLATPPGATSLSVSITPVAPSAQLTADGRLSGNVVTVALSSGGQPLHLKPGKEWTIVLRGPSGQPTSVIEQLTDGAWARHQTQPVGQPDVYASNSGTFGTFALVIPGPPGSATPCRTFDQAGSPSSTLRGAATTGSSGNNSGGGDGSGPVIVAAVIGGLILVGVAAFVVRTRSRGPAPPPAGRRGGSGRGPGRGGRPGL